MAAKKGQGGVEVSILVILIALFILIYVILLPPAEREVLLNETLEAGVSGLEPGAKVLFSESPGKVYSYSNNIQTAKLEPVRLYSKDETETSSLVKSLAVSRNLLKDNFRNIIFNLEDLDSLEELKLFMLVDEADGTLTIKLNNNIVYQGALTADQLPITLPNEYLQASNKLTFSVSLGGIFSSNYYILKDISLVKVYSREKTEAKRLFFVDMAEGERAKSVKLKYIVNCNQLEPRGVLTIKLNNYVESKDTIFCEYSDEISLPLDRDHLSNDGRNRLDFSVDMGDYSLEQMSIVTELGKSIYPKYVFDIDSELYSELQSGSKELILKLKFKNTDRKKASIIIQDMQFSFDTSSGEYSKDITSMVDDGANYIKIVPKNNFEILSLQIIEQPM